MLIISHGAEGLNVRLYRDPFPGVPAPVRPDAVLHWTSSGGWERRVADVGSWARCELAPFLASAGMSCHLEELSDPAALLLALEVIES